MFDLNKLVRPNILQMKPYSSARKEYTADNGIFLDANENPYGLLNRYPDPQQVELKEYIANQKQIEMNNIFIGNGSDELIDLAFRIFCRPALDKAIVFSPSYGMYNVSAATNDLELISIELDEDFQIDIKTVIPYFNDPNIKLLLICSPNNPTGNLMDTKTIESILLNFNGIVIIDEAYIEFADKASWLKRLAEFPNLIISQTLSKAWGLAAIRLGIAFASTNIIQLLNKIKPPYNISTLNQVVALKTLTNGTIFENNLQLILQEKKLLIAELGNLTFVKKVYPSDANFILIKVSNADRIYQKLLSLGIIVRNRNRQIPNCLRISVGTTDENKKLISALKMQTHTIST